MSKLHGSYFSSSLILLLQHNVNHSSFIAECMAIQNAALIVGHSLMKSFKTTTWPIKEHYVLGSNAYMISNARLHHGGIVIHWGFKIGSMTYQCSRCHGWLVPSRTAGAKCSNCGSASVKSTLMPHPWHDTPGQEKLNSTRGLGSDIVITLQCHQSRLATKLTWRENS